MKRCFWDVPEARYFINPTLRYAWCGVNKVVCLWHTLIQAFNYLKMMCMLVPLLIKYAGLVEIVDADFA